ncbi:hypothetical protein QJS66_18840 [Kocuria rhizophila]|nr:hypothetical protein QJS66_18840 [Kocuria rhizophila]
MTDTKISVENMYPWRVARQEAVVYFPALQPAGPGLRLGHVGLLPRRRGQDRTPSQP